MTPDDRRQIPVAVVSRFVQAFDDFITCLRAAIAEALADPATADSELLSRWQTRAFPVLERYQGEIHAAAEAFARGDAGPIVNQASYQEGLAKNLDIFLLDFAGPEYEKKLDDLETLVVLTSYRVCQAAGLP